MTDQQKKPDAFDPYYTWLGIASDEQPADHYRLLSVERYEQNLDVIENGADRQMAHLRNFQTGERGKLSQELLNEIAAAKRVLLNPQKKAEYDAQLKAGLNSEAKGRQARAVRKTKSDSPAKAKPSVSKPAASAVPQVTVGDAVASTTSRVRRRPAWQQPLVLGGAGALLVVVLGVGFLLTRGGGAANPDQKPPAETDNLGVADGGTGKPDGGGRGKFTGGVDSFSTKGDGDGRSQSSSGFLYDDRPVEAPPVERDLPVKLSGPMDALKEFDLTKYRIRGDVWREEGVISVGGVPQIHLTEIPVAPPEEYTVDVTLERTGTISATYLVLVMQGRQFGVLFDGFGERNGSYFSGIDLIDNLRPNNPNNPTQISGVQLPNDEPIHIRAAVRKNSVVLEWNGNRAIDWTGDSTRLSLPPSRVLAHSDTLGLSAFGCIVKFSSYTITPGADPDLAPKDATPPISPPVPLAQRDEIPSQEDLESAAEDVQTVYGEDLKAAESAEQKLALAMKLLDRGQAEDVTVASRYQLWTQARQLALEIHDFPLAVEVIDKTAQRFKVDALSEKLAAISDVRLGTRDKALNQQLVQQLLELARAAVPAERLDVASQALDEAVSTSRSKVRDGDQVKFLVRCKKEVDELKKLADAAGAAREKLARTPDDPASNLAVGRSLCFISGDWEQGLPLLAKSDDEALRSLAQQELQQPTEPKAQAALADGWNDAAKKADAPVNTRMYHRVSHWYGRALKDLTGIDKIKADQTLKDIDALEPSALLSGQVFAGPVRGLIAYWPLDERTGNVADKMGNFPTRLSGNPKRIRRGASGALELDGVDDYLEVPGLEKALGGTATFTMWMKTAYNLPANEKWWFGPGIAGFEKNSNTGDIFWGSIDKNGRFWMGAGDGKCFTRSQPNDDQWHHIAMQREAETGKLQIYIDGQVQGQAVRESGVVEIPFSSIGAFERNRGRIRTCLPIALDDIRIYNRLLTPEEVQELAAE